jgi:hypothetical protein
MTLSTGKNIVNKNLTTNSSNSDVVEMIQKANESLVFYYFDKLMDFGYRYTGSDNCTRAGKYIYQEFQNMGLQVEYHNWSYRRFKSSNIIGTINGINPDSNKVFIMSAHYDSTEGSMGADDDGSGIAAIMSAAAIMKDYSFNHTIRFIAFSGEEVGTYGSYKYAREAYNRGDNIVGVLNADMVGYANSTEGGKKIRFFKVDRSAWIVEFAQTVCEKYQNLLDMTVQGIPNYRGSDHQAFLHFGFDSVFIAHYDGYPWGNSPEDTPDRINHTYEVKATKFLLALIAEIADKPIDVQIIIKTPLEGCFYLFNRSIFPISFAKRWYTNLRGTTIIIGRPIVNVEVYTNENIEYVIFCIDDIFISWDSEPPYQWKIQGKHYPLLGKQILRVYAYTESGKVAMDEMDIRIFTLSYQYGKW